MLTGSIVISAVPAIIMAVVVYFTLVILFRAVTEEELQAMPKGRLLVKVAKKCRLLR